MAVPSAVTRLYRARLAAAQVELLMRLRVLAAQQFNPADPTGSLAMMSRIAGGWATAAQALFAAETATWLAALVAEATGMPLGGVAPFAVPPVAGSTASGRPVEDLAGMAPAVYLNRRAAGWEELQAAAAGMSWLERLLASEPFRAANATTIANAEADDRLTGRYGRVTRDGACRFCADIADRGYIEGRAGFEAHAYCRCTATPEIITRVYSRAAIRRARILTGGPS